MYNNNAIEQYWDYEADKILVAKQARWVNARGTLTPTGRRIARTRWVDLSPAAQRVIARVCGLESY